MTLRPIRPAGLANLFLSNFVIVVRASLLLCGTTLTAQSLVAHGDCGESMSCEFFVANLDESPELPEGVSFSYVELVEFEHGGCGCSMDDNACYYSANCLMSFDYVVHIDPAYANTYMCMGWDRLYLTNPNNPPFWMFVSSSPLGTGGINYSGYVNQCGRMHGCHWVIYTDYGQPDQAVAAQGNPEWGCEPCMQDCPTPGEG